MSEETRATGPKKPNAFGTIESLHVGNVSAALMLTRALADAAMGLAENGGPKEKAKVTMVLSITNGKGHGSQVIDTKIETSHPTSVGRRTESYEGSDSVYCNRVGAVTLTPDTQVEMRFED